MKKKLVMLLVIGMCLLCGCNNKKIYTGQVVEAFHGTDSIYTQFVLLTEENKKIGILLDEQTQVWSFIKDFDIEAFKKGKESNVSISVEYTGRNVSMKTPDNSKIKAYIAKDIQVLATFTKDKLSLSDGTSIDMCEQSNSVVYQLRDGTELLRVKTPSGPNNVAVGGLEDFDDLSETAKPNVLAFYADQGLLYDVNSELERAYADYQQTTTKSEFNSYMLSQDISPTASNDRIMYFLTSVSLPVDGNNGQEMRLGAAFDRKTGKHISAWELFSCEKKEVIQTILDIAQVTDPVLRAEMEKAFSAEYIVLFQDNLEVSFPAGTLPSQEHCYMIGLDYNEEICKILNMK
jgi:hypothetical protein